ncbi:putative ubiquitin-like protein YukD [Paenibacillus sp. DS2015]|uniref:EsaB/YukD family protein n=1 Tax=Paenibacillus sp. DS2015 TaxID=3373917 RepID=UPI003D1E2505
MDYVMVTFQAGDNMNKDLKVPTFVTVGELLHILSEGLSLTISQDRRIQAEPIGRILDNSLTLTEEGVLHGALLTLI